MGVDLPEVVPPSEPDVEERPWWSPPEITYPNYDAGFNEYGGPSSLSRNEMYDYIIVSEGTEGDRFANDLLWSGFFDPDLTPEERRDARQAYFDYMGYDDDGDFFDWDAWREWYDSQ